MTERTTWADANRAARRLAEAWEMAGGPIPHQLDTSGPVATPATLAVSSGSVKNGHAAGLYWYPTGTGTETLPGGANLPRSARDSYDAIAARSDALLSLAAARRNKHRELVAHARAMLDEHHPNPLAAELLAALTEGWPA